MLESWSPSLLRKELPAQAAGNSGTGVSILGSGNCSGGGEAGREELEGVSCVGRADGGGITVVSVGASDAGSRVLPGTDREMVNAGLERQNKISDTVDDG